MTELNILNHKVGIDDGELVSYLVDEYEFIHQKGSPGWRNSDTEMFPVIGPTAKAGFRVQVPKGNAIQDQHGLLRELKYETVSKTKTSAVFLKTYKSGTVIKNSKYPEKSTAQWLVWPFDFQFRKAFALTKKGLEITFIVSGERDMPFMLGYHPAFKLYSENPIITTTNETISLDQVLSVGSRALEVADCDSIVLNDEKNLTLKTEGFGNFMLWTEVPNMICIEPITFYPYNTEQMRLHEGFEYLGAAKKEFKVQIIPG